MNKLCHWIGKKRCENGIGGEATDENHSLQKYLECTNKGLTNFEKGASSKISFFSFRFKSLSH